jgi:hypothetical protein
VSAQAIIYNSAKEAKEKKQQKIANFLGTETTDITITGRPTSAKSGMT